MLNTRLNKSLLSVLMSKTDAFQGEVSQATLMRDSSRDVLGYFVKIYQ